MKHLNKAATAVMSRIVRGLDEPGDSAKFDKDKTFMALHVSRLSQHVYAVAHYGEQMGDLMADPSMEFLHGPDGEWYPISWRNDYVGAYRESVELLPGGRVKGFRPAAQAEQASFANQWLVTAKRQQGIR